MNDFYVCECAGDEHLINGTDKEFDTLFGKRQKLIEDKGFKFTDTVIMNKTCKEFGDGRKYEIVATTKHLNLVHYTK